ncbi:hypothetical protein HPB52_024464 [Rhipicephalus sanguineus]|uniref:Uncharacterized protein n=1 Tax=Rhipicephalus sanguineus TaxID=34632 RepID=A0A9D4PB76_RHISA|nr:hypothetical protein HPB52_024464 [Rhipicephalus sanguineus]
MTALFANLPPFLDVPGTPPILWHKWKKIIQVHLKAAGGSGWEDKRRASALISALGVEGQRNTSPRRIAARSAGVQNAPRTTSTPAALGAGAVSTTEAEATTEYDTSLQFLDGLFAETRNVLAERHLFTSREKLPAKPSSNLSQLSRRKPLVQVWRHLRRQSAGPSNSRGRQCTLRAKLLSYGEALTLQKAEELDVTWSAQQSQRGMRRD